MTPLYIERSLPQDGAGAASRQVRSVKVNLAESPLGWLKARRMISDRQFDAGEALRRDYERAALGQRVTMDWSAPPLDGSPRSGRQPGEATVSMLEAKRRFEEAIASAGPGLSDILWRVVCACEAMPVAEKSLGWPNRAGRLVLGFALDRVADYYRVR
jgi:hypothetical protein